LSQSPLPFPGLEVCEFLLFLANSASILLFSSKRFQVISFSFQKGFLFQKQNSRFFGSGEHLFSFSRGPVTVCFDLFPIFLLYSMLSFSFFAGTLTFLRCFRITYRSPPSFPSTVVLLFFLYISTETNGHSCEKAISSPFFFRSDLEDTIFSFRDNIFLSPSM